MEIGKRPTIYTTTTNLIRRLNLDDYDEVVVIMRHKPKDIVFNEKVKWNSNMAPSITLLNTYQAGGVIWRLFMNKFRSEKSTNIKYHEEIKRMSNDVMGGKKIILVCKCHDYLTCHRLLCAEDIVSVNTSIRIKDIKTVKGDD